ncbi:MAG: hypothetical protein ACKV1O_30880 [Saprospiraceae bacterium]
MQNSQFISIIKSIRAIMPKLGVLMVIIVYLVSAYAGGSLLTTLIKSSALGFLIAFAIQCTRAVIVFFSQMNPDRPVFGQISEICAVTFGLISIYEMHSLTANYDPAVFVSLAILMVAGIIIEIFLLKEVKWATEQELINNPALLEQIQNNAVARVNLKNHLAAIKEAEASGTIATMLQSPTPSPRADHSKTLTIDDLRMIIQEEMTKGKGKVAPDVLDALEISLNGNSGNGKGKH